MSRLGAFTKISYCTKMSFIVIYNSSFNTIIFLPFTRFALDLSLSNLVTIGECISGFNTKFGLLKSAMDVKAKTVLSILEAQQKTNSG